LLFHGFLRPGSATGAALLATWPTVVVVTVVVVTVVVVTLVVVTVVVVTVVVVVVVVVVVLGVGQRAGLSWGMNGGHDSTSICLDALTIYR
jgi:hypothetical protein